MHSNTKPNLYNLIVFIVLFVFSITGYAQDEEITELLEQHEFGWGFSYQGIHSWITRFTQHKECMWDGAPCLKFNKDLGAQSLFKATPFLEYLDYNSHVIAFPPKKDGFSKL